MSNQSETSSSERIFEEKNHSVSTSFGQISEEDEFDQSDQDFSVEEIVEVQKKHPNCLDNLLFQRAPKYIKMGRKGIVCC